MVIAVTYNQENGQIGAHFGHADHFKLYQAENGKIYDAQVVEPDGQGHDAVVAFLEDYDVELVICRNIGEGAIRGLQTAGISVCPNVEGLADDAVEAFMMGSLQITNAASCGCDCTLPSCLRLPMESNSKASSIASVAALRLLMGIRFS